MDLGVMYRDGKGAPQDQPFSARLFQRACSLSDAACASIANSYELGIGVPKDLARAKALYQRSCNAKRSDAAEDIQKVWSNASCNVLARMK
jgi:TPR repeat protein